MPTVQQDTVFGVGPWTVNAKITDESGVASADIFTDTLLQTELPVHGQKVR